LYLFALLLVSFISSAAERLPRLDLLKFRYSEGMVAVMVPLPDKERRVDLAVQVEKGVDAGKYIHHRPRGK
tara:strand:- start:208 stop:420 length:213 start_codon:yes stop_codon:yes gene_type:complete